jgi:transcriptional regulator with XRE-family HTH domain
MRRELKSLTIHGQWLDWLRYTTGMSLAQIAEEVGVTGSMVSAYRRPKGSAKEPGERVWHAIAKLAGVDNCRYQAGPPLRVS